MDNNSEKGMKFSLGGTNADTGSQKKDDSALPVDGKVEDVNPVSDTVNPNNPEADLNSDEEYDDRRTVTISLVKNYSLYRKANDKVLPKRSDYIGSCIQSSRVLAANKEEVEAYFPNLIGLAPNNESFITRVKQYLNNIKILVDELGKTFDISFHYYHKKDYYRFKAQEEAIEEAYKRADRSDTTKIKKALKTKIDSLNSLESQKHRYGYPINIEDYLMYRHCLLYHDVAKDIALVNSDSSIRFYFKDDQKELDKRRKYQIEVNRAKANYVKAVADPVLFNAVYIQYCIINGLPVISSLAEDTLDKEIKLDRFSTDEPIKFNKICTNKDVKLMANIEMLIARGELVRSQYNQNITTSEGDFIGANMGEAIAWFKNPDNTSVVNAYMNKLKNI